MPTLTEISIGALSRRTGVAVSALRYYETLGLISSNRNRGGQRRFLRSDIRRVSFIKAAQTFGFSLPRIKELFSSLPAQRTPTAEDWRKISDIFKNDLNEKIDQLMRLRDALDGCIGCGCLSLRACQILILTILPQGTGPVHALLQKTHRYRFWETYIPRPEIT